MKIGKYEFDSKQQFETKKASLGVAIDEDELNSMVSNDIETGYLNRSRLIYCLIAKQ